MNKLPEWTKMIRVDEVIECLDVSKEIMQELMRLMPDAYAGEPQVDDRWPRAKQLARVWNKLSEEMRVRIKKAYEENFGQVDDDVEELVAMAEQQVEDGQARWSETGTSRR